MCTVSRFRVVENLNLTVNAIHLSGHEAVDLFFFFKQDPDAGRPLTQSFSRPTGFCLAPPPSVPGTCHLYSNLPAAVPHLGSGVYIYSLHSNYEPHGIPSITDAQVPSADPPHTPPFLGNIRSAIRLFFDPT